VVVKEEVVVVARAQAEEERFRPYSLLWLASEPKQAALAYLTLLLLEGAVVVRAAPTLRKCEHSTPS
jgi:hypothetical protein